MKIENNSWRTQLDKIFSKNVAEAISQYCKLQQGDAMLLAIGRRTDTVSESNKNFIPIRIGFLYNNNK